MSLINKVAAIIDSKKQIDEVTYLENQVSYDEGMSFLGIDLKSIIPDFPKNSSSTTENELIAIAKATKNRSEQELDLVYTVDKDPLGIFIPFLKKHNGSFITFDDSPECLEGNKPMQFDRVIIFSFPSEQDADNWWTDDGYQELSKHRRASTDVTIQKVKGMLPRK